MQGINEIKIAHPYYFKFFLYECCGLVTCIADSRIGCFCVDDSNSVTVMLRVKTLTLTDQPLKYLFTLFFDKRVGKVKRSVFTSFTFHNYRTEKIYNCRAIQRRNYSQHNNK